VAAREKGRRPRTTAADAGGGPGHVPGRKKFRLNDFGNSDRLVAWSAGKQLLFAEDASVWYHYDGAKWHRDNGDNWLGVAARRVVEKMADYESLAYEEDGSSSSPRAEFLKWVRSQQSVGAITAMMRLARWDQRIHCSVNDFDREPFLLNTRDCVVNLETGETLKHSSRLRVSQITEVPWVGEGGLKDLCPEWLRFLRRVQPDPEMRAYLRRACGYTATASTDEQVFFLHHGAGSNGKGVFTKVLMAALGEYAQRVPKETLLTKRSGGGGVPNDVARMIGKRLLLVTETPAGAKLDETLIKEITGQDVISARFMRGEFFDFTAVGKIHITTNHMPDTDGGWSMERRMHTIGWDVTIPESEIDRGLGDRIIRRELPGVLRWLAAGATEWAAMGLGRPESVREKTRAHIESSDPLLGWMGECLLMVPDHVETHMELYQNYKDWCEGNGYIHMSGKAFAKAIVDRGAKRAPRDPVRRRAQYSGFARIGENVRSGEES
jgi:putative DNA primase/helicase